MAVKALNNNVVVKLGDQRTTLANGMAVQEQRGKKDIVHGTVVLSADKQVSVGDKVWFPFYAALPIQYGGEVLHVVRSEDVVIVETK